jgi:4-hydroxy-tetrahydrodipicolinate synthase
MELSGTIVPMATPIDGRSGAVDIPTLERFTNSLVQAGVHGLFPGGSIGEFSSLTNKQNRTTIETVVDATANRVPILAGCCDTSVRSVIERIDTAANAGADAAVVVTPYYLSTTQEGLERFLTHVADCAQLPVILYNIPALTGNRLTVETVASLATHNSIIGLKDTSGDLTYHYRLITEIAPEFDIFQGATELAAASLDLGTTGLIAGPANVFPDELVHLYDAHSENNRDTVTHLMRTVVAPMVTSMDSIPTAAAIKYLVALDGIDLGDPLPPLPTLTRDERERLERTYHDTVEIIESTSTY